MTHKQRRVRALIVGAVLVTGSALWLFLSLGDNLVFFRSPTDLATLDIGPQERIRIGGLVVEGSLSQQVSPPGMRFSVTDFENTVRVVYRFGDPLPDLFREGQGVIAEGVLDQAGVFRADRVLAKHDETYMPPEVADILPPPDQRTIPAVSQAVGRGEETPTQRPYHDY